MKNILNLSIITLLVGTSQFLNAMEHEDKSGNSKYVKNGEVSSQNETMQLDILTLVIQDMSENGNNLDMLEIAQIIYNIDRLIFF